MGSRGKCAEGETGEAGALVIASRTLPGLYGELKALLRERDQFAVAEVRIRALVEALEPVASPSRLRREQRHLRTLVNQVAALDVRIAANADQRRALLRTN